MTNKIKILVQLFSVLSALSLWSQDAPAVANDIKSNYDYHEVFKPFFYSKNLLG